MNQNAGTASGRPAGLNQAQTYGADVLASRSTPSAPTSSLAPTSQYAAEVRDRAAQIVRKVAILRDNLARDGGSVQPPQGPEHSGSINSLLAESCDYLAITDGIVSSIANYLGVDC